MLTNPFYIIPWQLPYLENLKKFLAEQEIQQSSRSLVIMPHKQPWRYLAALYTSDKKAALLPKMISFSEMVDIWFAEGSNSLPYEANMLDQVWLLRQAVLKISSEDEQLASKFAKMNMDLFLPWGVHLSLLLEKIYINGSSPKDMSFKEEETGKFPAALLGALGRIDEEFRVLLAEKGWITKGLKYLEAMQKKDEIPLSLMPGKNQAVTLAAFSGLQGTESGLLKALWQAGAKVCLHADPAIVEGKAHWACKIIADLLKTWHARAEIYIECAEEADTAYSFFTGYDGHSQLDELAGQLANNPGTDGNTAIVLCDKEMLIPVMHHLTGLEINAAMGYPLTRSSFYELLNLIFKIQENRQQDNLYYWKDIIAIINIPFMDDMSLNNLSLKKLLKKIDFKIRTKGMYIDPISLFADADADADADNDESSNLVRKYLDLMVYEPANIKNMYDLAILLRNICGFFLTEFDKFSSHFQLDSEVISILIRKIVPALRSNEMAKENLPLTSLKNILDELSAHERIAFSSDTLLGIQLLGLSATTALNFKRVMVLDATDDILPGRAVQDPLLPESFNAMLKIPDSRWFEQVAAYDLFRLCFGAKEVEFFWYEGISQSGLIDSKKNRSRFVERLIWEVEKERNKILQMDEEPIKAAKAEIAIISREEARIDNKGAVKQRMADFLAGKISASALNDYISCPLAFVFKRLMNLREREKINEGRDHLGVGNCFHTVFKDCFSDYCGMEYPADLEEKAFAIFNKILDNDLCNKLPIDSLLFFKIRGAKKLKQYIDNLNNSRFDSIIKYVEEEFSCKFMDSDQNEYTLYGKPDRIDERDAMLHIIDYKTGEINKNKQSFWINNVFFEELENILHEWNQQKADEYLIKLKSDLINIQLPFYILLLDGNGHKNIADACFVDLQDKCSEKSIFNYKKGEKKEVTAEVLERIKIVVEFIIAHMRNTDKFSSLDGKCPEYCVNKMCKVMGKVKEISDVST